jgi:hypothetical protein
MRVHLLLAFSIVLGACSRIPGGASALTAQPPPAAASPAGTPSATDSAQPASQPTAAPQDLATATTPAAETVAPAVKLGAFQVRGTTSGTRFRLAGLDKLTLESAYTAPAGTHTQRVEVTDPHGMLYGSLQAQVAAGPDGAVSNQQALQVAGTTIERFRMVGTWQFVLSVDGTPLASTSADIVE